MKSKERAYEPLVYSEDQVDKDIKETLEIYSGFYYGQERESWTGEFFGFKYKEHFLKLDCGWVMAPEPVCPYCVAMLVRKFGNKQERMKFNAVQDLGREYVCWTTNKELARLYKKDRKRKIHRARLEMYDSFTKYKRRSS